MKKTYAVFGLGRYGIAVARELVENGMEVIAVDSDERIVNAAADDLPICKCADLTDPDVIRQLGISNVDVVIVAMANNLEASVMAVTLCKEIGVKTVIAKCANEMHQKIRWCSRRTNPASGWRRIFSAPALWTWSPWQRMCP